MRREERFSPSSLLRLRFLRGTQSDDGPDQRDGIGDPARDHGHHQPQHIEDDYDRQTSHHAKGDDLTTELPAVGYTGKKEGKEEGLKKGLKKGKEEGLREGKKEGKRLGKVEQLKTITKRVMSKNHATLEEAMSYLQLSDTEKNLVRTAMA